MKIETSPRVKQVLNAVPLYMQNELKQLQMQKEEEERLQEELKKFKDNKKPFFHDSDLILEHE